MSDRRISLAMALGTFGFWLVVLYAGADHPPPAGFIWYVLLDAIAAWLVYLRAPTYIRWALARKPLRKLRASRDGASVGLLFATIALLLPGTGEPDVHPSLSDRAIWYAVLAAIGAASAAVTYLLSAAVYKRFHKT